MTATTLIKSIQAHSFDGCKDDCLHCGEVNQLASQLANIPLRSISLPSGWSLSKRVQVTNVGVWNAERRKYVTRHPWGYWLTIENGMDTKFLEGTQEQVAGQIQIILSNYGYTE